MSRCRCPGSVPVPLSRLCPGSVPVPLSRLRPGAAVPVLFALDPAQVLRGSGQAARPRRQARGLTRARGAAAPSRRPQRGVAAVAPLADHRSCCGCHARPHTHQRGRDQHLSRRGRGPRQNFRRRREVDSGIRYHQVPGMSIFRSVSDPFQIRFQIHFRPVSDPQRNVNTSCLIFFYLKTSCLTFFLSKYILSEF